MDHWTPKVKIPTFLVWETRTFRILQRDVEKLEGFKLKAGRMMAIKCTVKAFRWLNARSIWRSAKESFGNSNFEMRTFGFQTLEGKLQWNSNNYKPHADCESQLGMPNGRSKLRSLQGASRAPVCPLLQLFGAIDFREFRCSLRISTEIVCFGAFECLWFGAFILNVFEFVFDLCDFECRRSSKSLDALATRECTCSELPAEAFADCGWPRDHLKMTRAWGADTHWVRLNSSDSVCFGWVSLAWDSLIWEFLIVRIFERSSEKIQNLRFCRLPTI